MNQPTVDSNEIRLEPLALKDAPALIEKAFPALKISFESQRERSAGRGQTLPSIGSYWKGRKPLILVRAIVLGCLLPSTEDSQADLRIFESLMALDNEGLARRAFAQNQLRPADIAARIDLENPWDYFAHNVKLGDDRHGEVEALSFPFDADTVGIKLRWRRDISDESKLSIYRRMMEALSSYEEKASVCKRPEELDQEWLLAHIWPTLNQHYARLGINAHSFPELVEQLGILRYGKRPRVGDSFCGGGSIPFEAARLGCDVYASDLNPVACMLTWGAINIIGASQGRRKEIEQAQRNVAEATDREISALGVEFDKHGNRAKSFLYCCEVLCPETGWKVPLLQDRVISKKKKIIAELVPNESRKHFDIRVREGVSDEELKEAKVGTMRDNSLTYELKGNTYRVPIRTLRGDYRGSDGGTKNRLRRWKKEDFKPQPNDVFQERLYAIQWLKAETLNNARPETFFTAVTEEDLDRERKVENIVAENLSEWQEIGLVPDMAIEPGYNTDQPIRERGWTYWHHLFNPRNLLLMANIMRHTKGSELAVLNVGQADWNSKKVRWDRISLTALNAMTSQALDTNVDWLCRASFVFCHGRTLGFRDRQVSCERALITTKSADKIEEDCELFVTDPPYADAVNYHEITEYFIAWLRRNPPAPFDQWTWDSRRALAIKGSGDEFRRGMVEAYTAMANHMPDNGMQCVMFTHQDTEVWSDMVGIFWAAGLQVVAAWYIATETTSELKKGGYVQGTVILMLRKRTPGHRPGFRQRILPAVRTEVERQIEQMMHLNEEIQDKHGEPVFNDSDLQMAGYAAALKVLTSFTTIGGENVTTFALRPRRKSEVTVVDEIVQQASEAANSLLVPEGLDKETWSRISGIQRFYLRMMDMETTGAAKLDNYQNFAKAFRVNDYTKIMGSMKANQARLKAISKFSSRELTESTELGRTPLGRLFVGIQQIFKDTEPKVVVGQLQEEMPDFMEVRPLLIAMLEFIAMKSAEDQVRTAAEVLGGRLKNLPAIGQ